MRPCHLISVKGQMVDIFFIYLTDTSHSESESSGLHQEGNFELEEILQSELGT